VGNALFGGVLLRFAAIGALASQSQVHDFRHAKAQRLRFARGAFGDSPLQCRIPVNCADKVAGITAAVLRCAESHTSSLTMELSTSVLKRIVPADANRAGAQ
jgi:hypothetical protein